MVLLQDQISRPRRLHRFIRLGFLSWTLLWLGFYAGAQLTVLNLITYAHTAVTDLRWDYVLADPLITIISLFSAWRFFLWGRAVFCGWLCPFGALQELANKFGRALRLPQLTFRARFMSGWRRSRSTFRASANPSLSWDLAMTGAEVEPFKAAIILRFMAEWPMVVYAAGLVVASLFVERFYCRFCSSMGVDWPFWAGCGCSTGCIGIPNVGPAAECVKRCVRWERSNGAGEINMNECFDCLDCQVTYYDDHICPPMAWRRKRRAKRQAQLRPSAVGSAPGISR